MKIFVTGSSGFVARFLIPGILSEGHSVIGIDKQKCESGFGNSFQFVEGNILDEELLRKTMKGCDAVIHLAAEHQDFGVPDELFFEVNVNGTQKLLDFAESYSIQSFIFYSSVAVYGNNEEPSHEKLPANPISPYGKSKHMVEQSIEAWYRRDTTRKILILRPAVVFGPYNYANMYKLIHAISRGRYLAVGKGENIKSIAYVENITDATIFLMKRMQPGIEIYNYVDSPQLQARAIAAIVAGALNVRLSGFHVPVGLALGLAYPFDVFAAATNINLPITSKRIKKFTTTTHHLADKVLATGFIPRFSTEEGLKKMVSWYLAEARPKKS
jgi:GlcNAc-P-P-Und epimerase